MVIITNRRWQDMDSEQWATLAGIIHRCQLLARKHPRGLLSLHSLFLEYDPAETGLIEALALLEALRRWGCDPDLLQGGREEAVLLRRFAAGRRGGRAREGETSMVVYKEMLTAIEVGGSLYMSIYGNNH